MRSLSPEDVKILTPRWAVVALALIGAEGALQALYRRYQQCKMNDR